MDKNFTKQIRLINEIDSIIHAKMLNESFMTLSLDEQILLIEQTWNPFKKEFYSSSGGPAAAWDATTEYVSDIDWAGTLDYVQTGLSIASVSLYTTALGAASTGFGAPAAPFIAAAGYVCSAFDGLIDLGRSIDAFISDDPAMGTLYLGTAALSFVGGNSLKSVIKIGSGYFVEIGQITSKIIKDGAEGITKEASENIIEQSFKSTVTSNADEIVNYTIKNATEETTEKVIKKSVTDAGEEAAENSAKETLKDNATTVTSDLVKNNLKNNIKDPIKKLTIGNNPFSLTNPTTLRNIHNLSQITSPDLFPTINPNSNQIQTFRSGFQTDDNTVGGFPAISANLFNTLKTTPFHFGLDPNKNYPVYNLDFYSRLLDPALDKSQQQSDKTIDQNIVGPQDQQSSEDLLKNLIIQQDSTKDFSDTSGTIGPTNLNNLGNYKNKK